MPNFLTQAQRHTIDHKEFTQRFNDLFQMTDPTKIIPFVEDFVSRYPLATNMLLEIYKYLSKLGYFSLCNEISLIYLNAKKRLHIVAQKQFGLPPIFYFKSISNDLTELVDQAAVISFMTKLGVLTQKPVLPSGHLVKCDFTSALMPYLEDCFEIISGEMPSLLFQQCAVFAPNDGIFYQISDNQYGHHNSFFCDENFELAQKNINPYAFQLKEITVEKAMKFLASWGLDSKQDFVVIQVIEDDINIVADYVGAIQYLISRGLKVFKIGSKKTITSFQHNDFIDLTQIERPCEVDIFLCASARFYLGPASGLYRVSHNFGVPCCIPFAVDYGGVRPNNFVQYLKFEDVNSNQTLLFSDIHDLGLNSILSSEVIANNLKPQFPSSKRIIELVREMLEYLEEGEIFQLNVEANAKKLQYKLLGGLCSESLSLLPQIADGSYSE
jgi:putative glycosyltransferase (TIGR04372 family)